MNNLAAVLAQMANQRITGGANNIPKTTDVTTQVPTNADTTPGAGFQPMDFTPAMSAAAGSGSPRYAQPGIVGSLMRAGRGVRDMAQNQPGTLGSLLGMISKALVAGKSTYPTSYYTSPGAIEKPTVAGAFGDLAMQLGESRSVEDYLRTGDEKHLALTSPQGATLARDRLDQRKLEQTRQKERDEDIERQDKRERQERWDNVVAGHQRWMTTLEESANQTEEYRFRFLKELALEQYKENLKAWKSQGGTKTDFLDTITKLDDLKRAMEMELEDNAKKDTSYERRKGATKINQEFIHRFMADLRSGDPMKMYPAADAINSIMASDYDIRSDPKWSGYVKVVKREEAKSAIGSAKYGFENTREMPGLNEVERPENERPIPEIEAEIAEANAATRSEFGRMETQLKSGAGAPSAPRGPAPELPTFEDLWSQIPHRTEADRTADTVAYYQTIRPFGPLPGDSDTPVLGGVTLRWSESLGKWEAVNGQ